MNTAIFPLINASTEAKALLGTNPVRFFEFGIAPDTSALPYATWQVITGTPANLLDQPALVDHVTVQIDVWAAQPSSARAVAKAIRRVIESDAYVTAWRGETKDTETDLFRLTFNASFINQN